MFEGIRKKLSGFIGSLAKKEEERIGSGKEEPENAERQEAFRSARVSTGTKVKGAILREIRINENDAGPFIEELKRSLLGSDVNYDAAERILDGIKRGLLGKKFSSDKLESQISQAIRSSLLDILGKPNSVDLIRLANEKRAGGDSPLKILFIGPNGAGKTTTIAKIAHMLKKSNISCVISASDTFRAAAIEQTVFHANKLGVEVIKGAYGADPASIAFDAIAHAKARGIEAVLIDSAGRQETNKSLMEEIKKMVRVAKPDVKIFIGESTTGNALLSQVKEFKEAVGLDGIILTKLDLDAKGGNTLSILSETSVPILYFGTGEGYDDMTIYEPNYIVSNLMPS